MKQRLVSSYPSAEKSHIMLSKRTLFSLTCCLLIVVGLLAGLNVILTAQSHHTAHVQAPNNGNMPIGLNIDINEQSLNDMIKYDPRFQGVNNGALTEDANGNLSSDFEWVLDNRYTFAWNPSATNIDPLKKSTDLSGDYTLTFTGQATLTADNGNDPAHAAMSVSNQSYDAASNTTTATVTFGNPAGGLVGGIQFTSTKRNASDAAGNGVTNLHLWRPGYKSSSNSIFTDLWLNSIKNYPWSALRFMGVLGTNDYADPTTGEVYPYVLNWSTNRLQPGKGPAYGYNHLGVHGVLSYEDVVLIAQLTHKDIWINVPVSATDDYVSNLAKLFKNGDQYTNNQGIPDDVNVYVEYSNEMWHYGFHQGPWNNQAAQDEVKAGGTNLNYDNCNNGNDCWRFRRIAKRTIDIGKAFKQAFNDNGTRIRPVVNNARLDTDFDMLKYVTDNYGAPSGVLYGISQTTYYNSTDRSSVQSILSTLQTNSDSNVKAYIQGRTIASYYGLHLLAYEGGEGDTGDSNDQNLANQFAATRDPGMQGVEMHDLTNWFQSGGELYMQFAQGGGRYSTYGFWGLSDDLTNQTTGKWKGIIQGLNTPKPAVTAGVILPNSNPTVLNAADYQYYAEGKPGSANDGQENYIFNFGNNHLTLLLNVAQSGIYTFTPNVSANDGTGQIKVSLDNQTVTTVNVPNTGYNQGPWQDTTPVTLTLSAGLHALRIDGIPNTSAWSLRLLTFATASTSGSTPTPTSGGKTGPVTAGVAAGKCLDVRNRDTTNGTAVQLWSCNGTSAQQWTVASNGTLQALGKCLDVTGGATASGTLVQLWDCNGTGAQKWVVSNGGLQNPQSGRCLDVPNASTTDGTQLQIWDCNGTNAQKWTLPG